MKKYKQFIATSCLAMVLAVAPLVSSAQTVRVPNTMPVISGITAPVVLSTGETGTWTVNAFDPRNESLNYSVDWGDTAVRPLFMAAAVPVFTQTSTFTHAYANPGTYTIKFIVTDSDGIKTTSTVTVHVMQSTTVSAPVISNVTATSTKPRQATISWTTDVKSSSLVWLSTSTPVNTSGTANVSRSAKVVSHKINLTGLQPGTTYHVVVGSADAAGTGTSSEISFATPPVVTPSSNPVITSLVGSTTVAVGDTDTVTVNAFDPHNSPLTYSVDWGDNVMPMMMALMARPNDVFNQTSTFDHVYANPGTYTATFTVKNAAGLQATSSLVITVTAPPADTVPPVISGMSESVGASTSTISWMTDEPATSEVFYSTNTPVDVNASSTLSVSDDTLTTNHSLNISDLSTSTPYHFVIESDDASGNVSTSSESTFTTTSGM